MAICKQCGKVFMPLSVNQKYCSAYCGNKYRRLHDVSLENPSITFSCSQCGKVVVTEAGTRDKRTRFCSHSCEKKYWRHPHWERKGTLTNASGWQLKCREKSAD